jgi:hypothetical protein
MEIEMQAVTFYDCKQGKGGKKIHHKLSDVYGKDSYSLRAVKYWVHEFKAQRTDLHDEVRPGIPLIEISARIAGRNVPFNSRLHTPPNSLNRQVSKAHKLDLGSRAPGSHDVG